GIASAREDFVNRDDSRPFDKFDDGVCGASQDVRGLRSPSPSGVSFHQAHKRLNRFFLVGMVEDAKVRRAAGFRIDIDDVFQAAFGNVVQNIKDKVAVRVDDGNSKIIPDGLNNEVAEEGALSCS